MHVCKYYHVVVSMNVFEGAESQMEIRVILSTEPENSTWSCFGLGIIHPEHPGMIVRSQWGCRTGDAAAGLLVMWDSDCEVTVGL